MIVTLKFSTGKEIELTDQELKELYGNSTAPYVPPYTHPITVPGWQYPTYPYPYPVVTCKSGT